MSETLAQTPVFTATVRPEWVDYNGHMSEAYYVLIFGEATDAFYDHVGLDHAARQRDRVSIYTVEAHIRYLVEAHEAACRRHVAGGDGTDAAACGQGERAREPVRGGGDGADCGGGGERGRAGGAGAGDEPALAGGLGRG
jgi:hypothetical protein